MSNLLINGGFELDWGGHTCHIFPSDGIPYKAEVGNIFVPQDWTFWFRHQEGTWDQPEGRDAWVQNDVRRVHSGNKGFMFFSFYRKHDAGLYQQVQVTPGTKLHLTAWAHAWSNGLGSEQGGRPHDPYWSDGSMVGNKVIAFQDVPPLNGDPQSDANGNSLFIVGIDPTGGVDPFADTVVWGEGWYIYNGYCQQLSSDVVAQSDTVTVFLRSMLLWPLNHGDNYWDDIELTIDDLPINRGSPRVQYERTYILAPPDAGSDMIEAISRATWDDRRCTIGGSADDAGIGDLNSRVVIAVNPEKWGDDLADFYRTYYPLVTYAPVTGTVDTVGKRLREVLGLDPPAQTELLVCQCNQPWRDKRYADGRCDTYCHKGCWITACAIAQRYYGIDKDATPETVDALVGASAYTSKCEMAWSAMSKLGLKVIKRTYSATEAKTHLDGGDICFAEVLPTSLQHFVVITRYDGDRYWMLDPWKCKEGWLDETYTGVESWRLIKPVTAPPVVSPKNLIGMHLQTMTGGWDEYTSNVRPPVMKVLASMQDVLGIKRHSPETRVVWRHVTNAYGDTLECPIPMQGARNWVDKFRDSLYEVCNDMTQEFPGLNEPYFYVESLNEVYPSQNQEHVLRAANFDIAFIDALKETGLPVKPAVFCAAVGNPHESEYDLLVPLAKKCADDNGMMGLHDYWFANPNESGLESWWKYHAGRWTEIDKVFVNNGIYVDWYSGEAGAVGSADGYHLLANAGWKDPTCYNGDWNRYLADIVKFNQLAQTWNSSHGNRFKGITLFTTGSDYTGWFEFQLHENEMRDIANNI